MHFRHIRDYPIRTKLLISYIIIIVICMAFFSVIVYRSSSTTLREESRQTVLQTVNLARDNLLSYMDDIENTLFSVQANQTIQDILAGEPGNQMEEISALENELRSIDLFRKKISSIRLYLFDRPDYPRTYDGGMVFSSASVEHEPWYTQTLSKDGEICWNMFHISDSKGELAVSRTVIDTRSHRPLAVVRANIELAYFAGDMDQIRLGKMGKLFLVNDNHIINLNDNQYIKNFINNQGFFGIIQNEAAMDGYTRINGTEYLVTYGNLKSTHLKLVGAVRCTELDDSSRVVAQAIIFTGIISVLIAFLLLFGVSAAITRPINRLASAMNNYRHEKSTQLEIPSTDEIGTLYRSFNTMISTIDSLITDVNDLFQRQKVSELKALQAQINPHFLYNTLDSINWMAKKYGAKDISKLATSLGSFFRHSLNKGQEFTSIRNELEQIRSYVYIQKVRFKDLFDLDIHVDEDILDFAIVKLSIQPLVENCIVHAFEDIDYPGLIEIDGFRDGSYIYINVADNGSGADTEDLNRSINRAFNANEPIEKYGLSNVNQRIRLYFGNDCGLHFVTNVSGGVTCTIKIEVREL